VNSSRADGGDYRPAPLDTSSVLVPAELLLLVEELAAHAHETWALLRQREGWHYGPLRSDEAQTHPCLVPYDELPESEKTYDREVALGTIRAIINLGYEISRRQT